MQLNNTVLAKEGVDSFSLLPVDDAQMYHKDMIE